MLNRNKESLTLNLKSEEGKAIFRRLAERADVVLESFRPGVMERLGLGAEPLRELNPGLVYCAITGYGQDGPYRDKVGHDVNYMGYAGALSVTGERGRGPIPPGVQVADFGGGALLAAFAIASALYHRQATGQGQFIDVSMTDGIVSWLAVHFGPFFATGRVPARGEERLNGGWVCYGVFETKDREFVTLGALEPKFWQNFCRLVRHEEWVSRQHARGSDRDAVEAELRALFKTKTQAEWLSLLNSDDVCAGPVLVRAARIPGVRAPEIRPVAVDPVQIGLL
jgi:crotonobetainyl-CoA:carnitine CoA-transferase CaiB-like acyl-CoA transferase